MTTPVRVSPFEPIKIYDAPHAFLSQLLENEATFDSFVSTFITDDASLTPAQRTGYIQDLKAKAGGTSVGNALIDVVTNPFVWLGFAFSPASVGALKNGRLFMNYAKDTIVPQILKTGWQFLNGTAGGPALRAIARHTRDLRHEWSVAVGGAEERVLKGLGVSMKEWVRPETIRNATLRDHVLNFQDAMHGKLAGLDKDIHSELAEYAPNFFKHDIRINEQGTIVRTRRGLVLTDEERRALWAKQKDMLRKKGAKEQLTFNGEPVHAGSNEAGEWSTLQKGTRIDPALVAEGEFDRVLATVDGGKELYGSLRQVMQQRLIRMVAKETTKAGELVTPQVLERFRNEGRLRELIDPDKLLRLKSGYLDSHKALSGRSLHENDLTQMLLSRGTRKAMLDGVLSVDKFEAALVDGFVGSVNLDAYFPRNTVQHYSRRGADFARLKVPDSALTGAERAEAVTASARSRERKLEGLPHDFESLQNKKRWYKTTEAFSEAEIHSQKSFEKAQSERVPLATWTHDFIQGLQRYEHNTARDYAVYVARVDKATRQAQRDMLDRGGTDYWTHHVANRGFKSNAFETPHYFQEMKDTATVGAPPGGWNNAHALEQTHLALGDPKSFKDPERMQELFKSTLVPAAMGTVHREHAGMKWAIAKAQFVARKFAESPLGEGLMRGEGGKNLLHKLKVFGNGKASDYVSSTMGGAAGHLYSTHLGLNMGSVLLNLQQPWLHLSAYVGGQNVLKAYPDAVEEMYKYFKLRQQRHPFKMMLSQPERRSLIEEAFEFPDQVGVMGHVLEDLDKVAFQYAQSSGGKGKFLTQDLFLKLFEKAEWMNRLASVHALKHAYRAAGKAVPTKALWKTNPEAHAMTDFARDAERLVQETQFGADVLNTPLFFMQSGGMNDLFANPLIRQFQTFTVRAPLTFLELGPTLNAGRRLVRGTGLTVPWYIGDSFRALGTSAIIYEVGKNLLGADLSKGGVAGSVTDVLGGQRFLQSDNPLPMPPIASIGLNLAQGLLGGDAELLGNAVARTIPGGLALQRAMQVLPRQDGGVNNALLKMPQAMQKQYADWSNPTRDGLVPVYKGNGVLQELALPHELVLQGLGVDLARHKEGPNIAKFLVKNRPKTTETRQKILMALAGNRHGTAKRLQRQYEREMGIPITVTKEQMNAFLRNRSITRTERMLDQMGARERYLYKDMIAAGDTRRLGVDADVLRRTDTTGQRTRTTGHGVKMDPGSLEILKNLMADVKKGQTPGGARSGDGGGFLGWQGYTRR